MSIPALPAGYEAERVLGAGTQGTTVLARSSATGRRVVVKAVTLAGSTSWKDFELFEREGKVLRSLEHPAIPAFIAMHSDESAGRFWLVMEHVEGDSLGTGIRESDRYTDDELLDILEQLLAVLEYLHGLNPPVFHRDIKPDNVVRDREGKVSLVDFGGVRAVLRTRSDATVVGTFGYMAPEQLRGVAGPATDLYALGATIAAVAAGVDASELPTIGLAIDVAQILKPGPIRRAVTAMLEPDPRERAASVADVRARLRPPPRAAAAIAAPEPTRSEPVALSLREDLSWIDRPLLRTPQFIVPILALAVMAAAAVGSLVAFPFALFTLLAIALPVAKGVRRGMRSPD